MLSQRQQGHLLPQPGGAKELLVGLAGHALLQPFGTEGTGPLWLLFSSVPLLLGANSPRAVLPTAGGSQGEEAVSGLGQQSENHLAFLS